jgi:acyl-lipid omega-6 desaturase (Delta-12 desaturase)
MHWPTFAILSFDIFLIVSSWKLSFMSPLYFSLGVVFLSLALFHLYLLLHEATHSAVSHSKTLNDIVGHLCGWLIIMPYLPRQSSHLLHHTWTGHPVRDPANNRMIQRFSVITPAQVRKLEFVWKYWFPAIIVNDRVGLWLAPFQQRANGLKSSRVKLEILWARLYAAGYVLALTFLIATGYAGHFFAIYLPSLLIVYMLEELANLPHHAETPLLNATDKALPYWEQHQVTHSCKEVPIWSRFVLLNFNLHTAHHLYPTAPWYGLARLQTEIVAADPTLTSGHETQNELTWSLQNRKRPLLNIMGHYFDKIPGRART